ncbi:single-stranded DNA-binding protein [Paucidesulfovibrio longus]|uniref:single-stranded DNA-binding protein n=1 Tax=Paucidesulfovibrio longus TaxID=889 RepID=UPI0003B66543|nr:single-stranded DNA-binding protein [Paucidesulfovibrio longus]
MAGSMNKVLLIGRLGQDPKLSYTQGGQAVANFTMATDEGYRDRTSGQKVERTEWHRIVAWRQTAEFCGNYLSKGRLVLVEGKLQTRKWQDQNGQDRYTTEIVASNVQGLDSRQDGAPAQGAPQGQGRPQQRQQGGYQQPPQGQQNGPSYEDEDLGPAFPSEASGMDDVPF